jgi:phosphoglycerate-specific signal transduction histidine kinase
MVFDENDPARVILNQLDQIESLIDCLEEIVVALRNDARHVEADKIMHAIRDQRFQAMLTRGQVATWG